MFPHRSRQPVVEPGGSTGARLATYAARARRLDPVLHAFVQFRDPERPVPGPLSGLPYAAKDIFAAPDRAPHGGLAQPLPPTDCRTADALRLLDEAGAVRLGYTALTEIAYEPSGTNVALGSVRNPWNPDFIPGGSSSGSAAAVASGSVVARARVGYRRLAAHPGAWLRRHRVEADPWVGLDARRDAARALARHHRVARARRRRDRGRPRLCWRTLTKRRSARGVVIGDALAAAHPSVARACQDGDRPDCERHHAGAARRAGADRERRRAAVHDPAGRGGALPSQLCSTATRSVRCCGAASPRGSTSMTRRSPPRWRSARRSPRRSWRGCNNPTWRSCR